MCIGDSITHGTGGRRATAAGVTRAWVDQLVNAFDAESGVRRGGGFRGLWRADEWEPVGDWRRPEVTDPFDVTPFRRGVYSSDSGADTLTWRKPPSLTVDAFDIFWFGMARAGAWQYRIDDANPVVVPRPAAPHDNRLHTLRVHAPVAATVEVAGVGGADVCAAPIAGIAVYENDAPARRGTLVDNLGCAFDTLATFCRDSRGDPLAILDDLRPDLVTIEFSNDVMIGNPDAFAGQLRRVIDRVRPAADVLLIAPFEQQPRPRTAVNAPAFGVGRDPEMQARYRAVTREVAASHGCALLDLYDEWASLAGAGWAAADAHGLMYDRLHPSQAGHDDIAARVLALVGPSGQARPGDSIASTDVGGTSAHAKGTR